MSLSIIALCLWVLGAALMSWLPSKDHHWRTAYFLAAIGIPLLGWITYENGPIWGLIALGVGVAVLRWPVFALGRWIYRKVVK